MVSINKKGFTLIELLIYVGILNVLMIIIMNLTYDIQIYIKKQNNYYDKKIQFYDFLNIYTQTKYISNKLHKNDYIQIYKENNEIILKTKRDINQKIILINNVNDYFIDKIVNMNTNKESITIKFNSLIFNDYVVY